MSILAAWLAFGIAPDINAVSVLVVLMGSVTFVGMGMVLAYLIDDPESVNAMTYVVVLPLVVLSGSLFPVERLPGLLRFPSIISPLTYLTTACGALCSGAAIATRSLTLASAGSSASCCSSSAWPS
jgi:ABC-type multidrug transport system permease subunit